MASKSARTGKNTPGKPKAKPTGGRKAAEDIRREWSQMLSIFDSIDEAVYVADTETHELLFVNTSLKKRLETEPIGKKCYRVLQGRNSPCPFCTNDIIRKMKPAAHRWEHENRLIQRTYSLHDRIITWPDGRDVRLELAVDITDRKRIEDELRESERMLSTLMSNLPGMAYRCRNDRDWTMAFVSEGCRELTGYAPRVFMGADSIPFADIIHPEDRGLVWDAVQRGLMERRPFRISYRLRAADGLEKWVWEQGQGVRGPDGRIVALEGFIADVTELKRAEEALGRSKALLDTAGRMARFGGWSVYLADRRVVWSDEVARIHEMPVGYAPGFEEAIAFYAPECRDRIAKAFDDCARRGIPYDEEMEIITARGRRIWVRTAGEAVRDASGAVVRVEGAFQDITDRKRIEEQLLKTLADKDTLLRELYHRTKNNMDVIRAMLTLKAAFRRDPLLREFVADIDQKILAMAMAHEKLYQARDLSRIHLDEYLADLVSMKMRGHEDVFRRVALRLDFDRVDVLIDTAVPLGLVLNELLGNAAKFAFPNGRAGEIRVRLSRNAEGLIELDFADDGTGFPEGADIRERSGLGLKILFDIVENQLMGTIRCDCRRGTVYEIRFNDNLYTPRVTA